MSQITPAGRYDQPPIWHRLATRARRSAPLTAFAKPIKLEIVTMTNHPSRHRPLTTRDDLAPAERRAVRESLTLGLAVVLALVVACMTVAEFFPDVGRIMAQNEQLSLGD